MKFDKNSILKIARLTFKNKNINLNSNIDNVSNWDSINHVNFICEIQKKFKVKVSFEQTIAISSISDLIKLLKKIK
jgi:acyl carrier protein